MDKLKTILYALHFYITKHQNGFASNHLPLDSIAGKLTTHIPGPFTFIEEQTINAHRLFIYIWSLPFVYFIEG